MTEHWLPTLDGGMVGIAADSNEGITDIRITVDDPQCHCDMLPQGWLTLAEAARLRHHLSRLIRLQTRVPSINRKR